MKPSETAAVEPRVITQVETTAEAKKKTPSFEGAGAEQQFLRSLFLKAGRTYPTARDFFVVSLLAATLTPMLLIPSLLVKVLTAFKRRLSRYLRYV